MNQESHAPLFANPGIHGQTIVEIAQWRAQVDPDRIAWRMLREGQDVGHLCFAELDQRARQVGSALQQLGVYGERVALLYPTSLDFVVAFFGCLYAGAIAVPLAPPNGTNLSNALAKFDSVLRDASPKYVLASEEVRSPLRKLQLGSRMARPFSALPIPGRLGQRIQETAQLNLATLRLNEWHTLATLQTIKSDAWIPPSVHPETIAYLQYTSGSTGHPKGAIITHSNILGNLKLAAQLTQCTPGGTAVCWAPLFHDLGLLSHVLSVPYQAAQTILMSPLDFLRRPMVWLEAISTYQAHISAAPNFAYDLCIRKSTAQERQKLDLRSWQVAGNGGEPVRARTIQQFTEVFTPHGFNPKAFFPCFGAAEATLFITANKSSGTPARVLEVDPERYRKGKIAEKKGGLPLVSNGATTAQHQLLIVNPETHTPQKEAEIGEVWFCGPSVCQGYWNQERQPFGFLAHDPDQQKYLRTGDLGFLMEGELYLTGRCKDVLIRHGRNFYPQDIEDCAESLHSDLRPGCSAAFSTLLPNAQEHINLVCELRQKHPQNILQKLASNLAQNISSAQSLYLDNIIFVPMRSVPKTSSGKVRRALCADMYNQGTLPTLAKFSAPFAQDSPKGILTNLDESVLTNVPSSPQSQASTPTDIHSKVTALIKTRVTDLPNQELPPNLDLRSIGMDSIQLMELHQQLREAFQIPLELSAASTWTIRTLVEQITRESTHATQLMNPPLLSQKPLYIPLDAHDAVPRSLTLILHLKYALHIEHLRLAVAEAQHSFPLLYGTLHNTAQGGYLLTKERPIPIELGQPIAGLPTTSLEAMDVPTLRRCFAPSFHEHALEVFGQESPLMAIKLTPVEGETILAMSWSHVVLDGTGARLFLETVFAHLQGDSPPRVTHQRHHLPSNGIMPHMKCPEAIQGYRRMSPVERTQFYQAQAQQPQRHMLLRFSLLRAPETPFDWHSLAGMLWHWGAEASTQEETELALWMDIRGRPGSPIPQHYTGNHGVFWHLSDRQLQAKTLEHRTMLLQQLNTPEFEQQLLATALALGIAEREGHPFMWDSTPPQVIPINLVPQVRQMASKLEIHNYCLLNRNVHGFRALEHPSQKHMMIDAAFPEEMIHRLVQRLSQEESVQNLRIHGIGWNAEHIQAEHIDISSQKA
ncbi:MAG: AMP-binding protein [Myxococcota bacterium]